MKSNSDLIPTLIGIIGVAIGISFALTEGYKIYTIGYSILGSILLFTIIIDLIVSIPRAKRKPSAEHELSKYLAKSKDGDIPRFVKKIKESEF